MRRFALPVGPVVGILIACSGATQSELFVSDDGTASGSDSGRDTSSSVTDAGSVGKDATPVSAPIEIVKVELGVGDKGRIDYAVTLRNLSKVEMDRIDSIEIGFKGVPATVFNVNCNGNDWKVAPGTTAAVPAFATFNFPAQAQLVFTCNTKQGQVGASPGIARYGSTPLALTIRGQLKDGTQWYAGFTQAF